EEITDGPDGCRYACCCDRLARTGVARWVGARCRRGPDRRRDHRRRNRIEPVLLSAGTLLRTRLLRSGLCRRSVWRPLLLAAPAFLGWRRLAVPQRPRLRLRFNLLSCAGVPVFGTSCIWQA